MSDLSVAPGVILVTGAAQTSRALVQSTDDERHLEWLSDILPANAMLLTPGNVDPWRAQQILKRPVLYDAQNGGRQIVTTGVARWHPAIHSQFPDVRSTPELLDILRETGKELWFYGPETDASSTDVVLRLIPHEEPVLFQLVRTGIDPQDPDRAAFTIGPEIQPT